MGQSQDRWSRITENRVAVAVVVGSVLLLAALSLLYRAGFVGRIAPVEPPEFASLPLFLVGAVALILFVVWGWSRLFSFFR